MISRQKQYQRPSTSKSSLLFRYLIYLLFIIWVGALYYFITLSKGIDSKVDQSANAPLQSSESYTVLGFLQRQLPFLFSSSSVSESSSLSTVDNTNTHLRVIEKKKKKKEGDELIHIVFSTDCTFFQDWQSLMVFHSAIAVRQRGEVTRIASGCSEEQKVTLTALYTKLYPPQYHVHFTPDFMKDGKSQKKYEFYNKPYGLHHWLQYASPPIEDGIIVVLIDPDMILLRPFTIDFKHNPANLFMPGFDATAEPPSFPIPEHYGKGHPVAELYGLGAPWTKDEDNRNFNRTEICGVNSPCRLVDRKFGEQHYSVGPPYILEKTDMLKISEAWTTFVPRVYAKYPALLAEMFAYSMAAAHVDLPHLTMLHLMISNTNVDEEGWAHIDSLEDDVCQPPVSTDHEQGGEAAGEQQGEGGEQQDEEHYLFYPQHNLPTVLHYCQFFRISEYGYQKRRIKKSILECDKPLMAIPPVSVGALRYKNRDGTKMELSPLEARRNAFMLCTIHRSMNSMLRSYKRKMCGKDKPLNFNESINVASYEYWPW